MIVFFLLQPNNDTIIDAPTVGKAILISKGLFTGEWGFWLSIGALVGFIILFNMLYLWALTYLSRKHYSFFFIYLLWTLFGKPIETYFYMLCSFQLVVAPMP
jgi:hypothetical protein